MICFTSVQKLPKSAAYWCVFDCSDVDAYGDACPGKLEFDDFRQGRRCSRYQSHELSFVASSAN